MSKHSKSYYFFVADYCRIIVNILILLGIIFFVILLYNAFSKKRTNFNFLFKVMIHVMVCALLSIIGYLFNWTIKEKNNNEERTLLFGNEDDFLCKIQSIFLSYFQTTRESLLTSLTIIVFFSFKEYNIEKNKFKILIFIFCYGIPLISNSISLFFDGFGKNDLFCLTKLKKFGKTFGIIHFFYLILLLLINFALVLYIIYMDYKQGKEYEDWLVDEDNKSQLDIMNKSLKKIVFYPIAQIFSLIFPFIYRIGINSEKVGTNIKWAKISAIGNSFAGVLYTFIFIISNSIVLIKSTIEKNINKESENLISAELVKKKK